MAKPPPDLNDDAVAEILLRLPPNDPACLVRASLVCKSWRRVVSDRAFPGRYREFHPTPPLLGFLHGVYVSSGRVSCRFVPAATRAPLLRPPFECPALDCRDSRVLLHKVYGTRGALAVWDPITGDHKVLPEPDHLIRPCHSYSGVVLCAAAGCDHSGCHGGAFLVVFVGNTNGEASAWVYSSEAAAWSAPASVEHAHQQCLVDANSGRGAVVGDEVYFTLGVDTAILKYDLGKHCLSVIRTPRRNYSTTVLMPTEDGSLGLAGRIQGGWTLHLWSRQMDLIGDARWIHYRAIDLKEILPPLHSTYFAHVIGFAEEGVGVLFAAKDDTFLFQLKSGRVTKASKCSYDLIPFMSFYFPDFAGSKLTLPGETD